MLRLRDLIRALAVALVAASPAVSIEGPSVAGNAPLSALAAANDEGRDLGQPLVGRSDDGAARAAARPRRAPTDAGGLVAVVTSPAASPSPAPAGALVLLARETPHGCSLLSARSSRGPPRRA